MNEQLIDQVISPVVDEQVSALNKMLKDLDIQMVKNIASANQLNAVTGNSKSFKEYQDNATKTALSVEKIQQAQNRTAQTTLQLNEVQAKAAAAESARQAKAIADQQRRDAAQAVSDAKQIAAGEAKAAKLAEIERKANVQFPAAQQSNNPVTQEPDQPSVRYEPIITGQENMTITAQKSTEALSAETAAMLEQQEVLGSLSVAQRANIENLLALQVERAANSAELKELNVQDAVSGERAVFLTAEQLRLKVAISEVTLELNRQTKEMLAEDGAMKQLDASVLLLRNSYESLSVAERESENGQKMLLELQALDKENKALAVSTGNTSKEVGAYEKAIAKATSGSQLAATAVNVATRSIIRMIVQFALFGVVLQAAQWLYQYIAALEIFNPVASAAERAQKGLADAFAGSDYQKGIANVLELGANLELVKGGIEDSDTAINKYNETIGKTFGFVNNINDAQQGFIDHKDAYIKTILDEAAAMAIANDAAKEMAELAAKNEQLREGTSAAQSKLDGYKALGQATPAINEAEYQITENIKNNQNEIIKNNARIDEIAKSATGAIKGLDTGVIKSGGQKTGTNAVAEARNKLANEDLERQKIIAQKQIADDKLSYDTRLQAVQDFYKASSQIEKNNETTKLNELPKNDARRLDIQKASANAELQLQQTRDTQLQSLRDKAYKQDQEHLKASLEAQKDLFKQVSEDPNQSYSMKLIALDVYNKKALELIKTNYDEQVKEAGKNTKSVIAAEDEKKKATIQLANDTAAARLKIQKEDLQKILEVSKETEQEQLETLDNGAKLAAQALSKVKDDELNALALQRAKGIISEKEYNDDILAIQDQFNIARIEQEIKVQQAILAIKEGQRDVKLSRAKQDGATPDQLAKITSDSNKDIQPTKDRIATGQQDLGNAVAKQGIDEAAQTAEEVKKRQGEINQIRQKATDATVSAIDGIDKLRQRAYENEIARLEKQKDLLDENAQAEKDQVNDSILSSATKARKIAVIDAQTASQKKALTAQENKEKTKAAKAEKEGTIAKIIATGALAVVSALATQPAYLGIILAAITGASVAVELATAIATPLPTFAKGGKTPGGNVLWGEAGMERATLPDGTVKFSTGATIEAFPRNTVITPHMELMQQLRPAEVKYTGGEQVGWKELLKAYKGTQKETKRALTVVHVNTEFESYKRRYLSR